MKIRLLTWVFPLLVAAPACLWAQSATFRYQGRLLNSGQPANGDFDLRFELADAVTNGNWVGPTLTNAPVTVTNGYFAVTLDFGAGVFDGSARWLEIGVRSNGSAQPYTVLSPRQAVTSVPYAAFAALAGSAVVSYNLAGGGATLTNIPGGMVQPGTITSNQIDAATWQLATATATNVVQAIGDPRYAGFNAGRGSITPYDCGAIGDGVADDTAAWQCFLNSATKSNLVAFVPPAVGPYYRITDTLWVTNLNGLRLIGAGGQFHSAAAQGHPGQAHIRQFTPGKHGIVITLSPAGGLTDSIHIEGLNVTAEFFSPDTWGIAFHGDVTDSDCDVIQECGIKGFGVGLYLGSTADCSIISCSFGLNGDGIRLPGGVLNSLRVQTSQLSYNYSNQVHVLGGNLVLDSCDLAAGALLDGDWGAYGIKIEERGWVDVRSCNFECYGTNPAVLITVQTNFGGASIRLSRGSIMRSCAACPGPNTYSVVSSNGIVYFDGIGLNSLASDGFPVLEVSNSSGNPESRSLFLVAEKFIVGSSVFTNYVGPYPMVFGFRSYVPLKPGQFMLKQSVANDMSFLLTATLPSYGFGGPSEFDLLQYFKDKSTFATFNSVAAGWFSGDGSGLTNLDPAAFSAQSPVNLNSRNETVRTAALALSAGWSRLAPDNPSPSPCFFADGIFIAALGGTAVLAVPAWATNVQVSALLQATAYSTWTNLYQADYFVSGLGRIRLPPTAATVTADSDAVPFSFTVAFPDTNCIKQIQLTFGASTNLATRYLASPLTLIYN